MPNETWYDEATRLVTAPRPHSEAEARERGEAALRLVHEALTEEANGRLAVPPKLFHEGATIAIRYIHGQPGYEDEGGGVTEPVEEGYHAALRDAEGSQLGEGMGATPNQAVSAIRILGPDDYSDEPPFDLDAQPLSDPGEFPAV